MSATLVPAHGYDIGTGKHGGYAEFAAIGAALLGIDWVLLPIGPRRELWAKLGGALNHRRSVLRPGSGTGGRRLLTAGRHRAQPNSTRCRSGFICWSC